MEYVCEVCKDRIYPNARGQIRLVVPVADNDERGYAIDSQFVQRTVLTDECSSWTRGVEDRAAR